MSLVSAIEVDTALDNLSGIWNQYKEQAQKEENLQIKIHGLEEQVKQLEDDLASTEEKLQKTQDKLDKGETTDEIDFETLDVVHFYFEKDNMWVRQIMENVEKIVAMKGTKYLLDRLDISVKAITQ